jgi:two-component system OmpR family sensor kinase
VLAVTVITLVAFDVAAVAALRRYLVSQTDSRLQAVSDFYLPMLSRPSALPSGGLLYRRGAQIRSRVSPAQGPAIITPAKPSRLPPVLDQYRVEWLTTQGTRLLLVGNPVLQARLPANGKTIKVAGVPRTVLSRRGGAPLRMQAVAAGGSTLVVTTSLAGVDSTVRRMALIVAAGSVAALLLAGLGVAAIVRRGLRPIEAMAAAADKITAGDLTDRVGAADPTTEVGRLAAALNGMLARIEAAVTQREESQLATRQFFADASHELRTPLASLRANAELYQQGALPARRQVDRAMAAITAEAQRMGKLVDDMLRLARIDQHPAPECEPVNVSALIAAAAARAAAADPARSFRTRIQRNLNLTGDGELLRRAVDNLLANITAHTPPGTTAIVTVARRPGAVAVTVADDGPGVPDGKLPRIFDRFYRAGPPAGGQPPGSGLGLAIVSAAAMACHGTATAAARRPHGLRVTLTLPVASPQRGADAPGTEGSQPGRDMAAANDGPAQ